MTDSTEPQFDAQFVAQLTECQLAMLLYARALLPGDPAAHDIVQQANAKIWEKRNEFQSGTNFKAWVFSIVRYEVLNYRKRQARDARLVFSGELEETLATELSTQADSMQDRHEALKECLEQLRAGDRELLLHRYSNPGTLAEYAATVGRSVAGLRVTLHRLRSALLECIERKLAVDEATT